MQCGALRALVALLSQGASALCHVPRGPAARRGPTATLVLRMALLTAQCCLLSLPAAPADIRADLAALTARLAPSLRQFGSLPEAAAALRELEERQPRKVARAKAGGKGLETVEEGEGDGEGGGEGDDEEEESEESEDGDGGEGEREADRMREVEEVRSPVRVLLPLLLPLLLASVLCVNGSVACSMVHT